jgi:hypothetical protein
MSNGNRLAILEWREHGDDEDSLEVHPLGADDDEPLLDWVRWSYDIPAPENPENCDGEEGTIYSNADYEIVDGEILEFKGRKFRIRIEEVTE